MQNVIDIAKKEVLTPIDEFEKNRSVDEARNDLSERYLGRPSLRYYKEYDFSELLPSILKKAKRLMLSFEKKHPRKP